MSRGIIRSERWTFGWVLFFPRISVVWKVKHWFWERKVGEDFCEGMDQFNDHVGSVFVQVIRGFRIESVLSFEMGFRSNENF